jgi:hypothetical protein
MVDTFAKNSNRRGNSFQSILFEASSPARKRIACGAKQLRALNLWRRLLIRVVNLLRLPADFAKDSLADGI